MKFLHLADLHLGGSFPHELEDRRLQAREDRFILFERAIDYCNQVGVDYLILAGDIVEEDMFKRQDLHRLLDNFKRLTSTRVLYLFGNHDFRWGRYLIETGDIPDNLYFFDDNQFTYYDDEEAGVRFIGQSWDERKYHRQLNTDDLEFREGFQHILIHHGNVNMRDYFSLNTEDKTLKNFDYIAMGHIHSPFHDRNIYMPGTPEPLDYGDIHPGAAILASYYGSWKFEPVQLSDKRIQVVEIDLTQEPSMSEIKNTLKEVGHDHSIFQITWTGTLEDTNYLTALEDFLRREAIEFRSKDETELAYDLEVLRRKNADNLLGEFINYMSDHREMDHYEDVLKLGIQALLGESHD